MHDIHKWRAFVRSPLDNATKLLKVQEGNIIVFERENDKIVIKPAKTLRDFKGLSKDTKKVETFQGHRGN